MSAFHFYHKCNIPYLLTEYFCFFRSVLSQFSMQVSYAFLCVKKVLFSTYSNSTSFFSYNNIFKKIRALHELLITRRYDRSYSKCDVRSSRNDSSFQWPSKRIFLSLSPFFSVHTFLPLSLSHFIVFSDHWCFMAFPYVRLAPALLLCYG